MMKTYRVWQMLPEHFGRLMMNAYRIKIEGLNSNQENEVLQPVSLDEYQVTY